MKHAPAPALAKGIMLIEQLAIDGQASLEHLSKKNGWPKSSTLRYLQTLEGLGIASQNPQTLHWHVEKSLRPLSSTIPKGLTDIQCRLPQIADLTGHCTELYRVENRIVRLIDRVEPERSEIQVNARIGFTRDLRELDATAGIFYALTASSLPSSTWHWEDGARSAVSEAAQHRILDRIRNNRMASDHSFNENGIRRHAIPIEQDGVLIGILAVAQHLTPKFRQDTDRILNILSSLLHPSPTS